MNTFKKKVGNAAKKAGESKSTKVAPRRKNSRAQPKVPPVSGTVTAELTIADLLKSLMPSCIDSRGNLAERPIWPPDAFVIAASILKRSGKYTQVITEWPPRNYTVRSWHTKTREVATSWKKAYKSSKWPASVESWWSRALINTARNIEEMDEATVIALVGIVAAADEACFGIGITNRASKYDRFVVHANGLLQANNSLCEKIEASRALALPKFHNPLDGMTVRSLTHNLALWETSEVKPIWRFAEIPTGKHGINLLVLPWPLEIAPSSFQDAGDIKNLRFPKEFGLFRYNNVTSVPDVEKINALVDEAVRKVGRVDAIVFPELSMTPLEFDRVRRKIDIPMIIAGTGFPGAKGALGENRVAIGLRTNRSPNPDWQLKHHRWRLEAGQIKQYGLGASLRDKKSWWEATNIKDRTCMFFGANEWLTFCALICEDLARQDPVSQLVRAIGPNLVIALLLDGPQVPERWSARYSTVLADDPRSSVLTLTSAGMVDLAISQGNKGPRSVGLWKDATSPVQPLILKDGSEGLVLCLSREFEKEWTADGRDDGRSTGYLRLTGVHQVSDKSSGKPPPVKAKMRL